MVGCFEGRGAPSLTTCPQAVFSLGKAKTLIDGRFAFEPWPGSAQLELTPYTGIGCQLGRGDAVLLVAERVNTS
jgi:hypothetical protein